jgi:Zn-dependent protease with chaperone function
MVTTAPAGPSMTVLRTGSSPYGLPLPEPRAPELWATVRELAAAVGARPPDEIRLVAEVEVAVSEDTRLLGLAGGRRRLHVGLPLLQAFTVGQLRAVLAHELGRYSRQRRLGEPAHRGRQAIRRRLALPPAGPARWLLRGYARAYFLASAPASRAQEIEAGRAAVRLAGRTATLTALRALPGLAAAWRFYLETYVTNGLAAGVAPTGVLSCFPTMLAARAGELARIRAEVPPARPSRWDPHPPDAERIARLGRDPAGPVGVDGRPAVVLVPQLGAATAELEEMTFDFGDRPRVPPEQYTAAAAQWHGQRAADSLYRAATRLAGGAGAGSGVSANLGTVLDLLAAGRLPELAVALLPATPLGDPPAATGAVVDALTSAIAAALGQAGAARWQHSWSGPPVLLSAGRGFGVGGPSRDPVDVRDLALRAVAGEPAPAEVAKVRAELVSRGVDLEAATAEPTAVPGAGADPLAGIANAVVDGRRQDLVVTSQGLVIFPSRRWRRPGAGRRRMQALLTDVPVPALATMPGHRYLPFEDLAAGTVLRRSPASFEFGMRSGGRLKIGSSRRSREVGEGWEALGHVTAMLAPPA